MLRGQVGIVAFSSGGNSLGPLLGWRRRTRGGVAALGIGWLGHLIVHQLTKAVDHVQPRGGEVAVCIPNGLARVEWARKGAIDRNREPRLHTTRESALEIWAAFETPRAGQIEHGCFCEILATRRNERCRHDNDFHRLRRCRSPTASRAGFRFLIRHCSFRRASGGKRSVEGWRESVRIRGGAWDASSETSAAPGKRPPHRLPALQIGHNCTAEVRIGWLGFQGDDGWPQDRLLWPTAAASRPPARQARRRGRAPEVQSRGLDSPSMCLSELIGARPGDKRGRASQIAARKGRQRGRPGQEAGT